MKTIRLLAAKHTSVDNKQSNRKIKTANNMMEVQKLERTLSIVKPDGVEKNLIGDVVGKFEKNGLRVIALKMLRLSKAEAEGFYAVHKERAFFASLTDFMSSGPCVALVLEGEDAISRVRETMGATDPSKATPGTIRKSFATNIERNIVHGSDSPQSASFEIGYFFSALEVCGRDS
jgi:nucleoside-diphosphate kinase